jgi:hypothetical protein
LSADPAPSNALDPNVAATRRDVARGAVFVMAWLAYEVFAAQLATPVPDVSGWLRGGLPSASSALCVPTW